MMGGLSFFSLIYLDEMMATLSNSLVQSFTTRFLPSPTIATKNLEYKT